MTPATPHGDRDAVSFSSVDSAPRRFAGAVRQGTAPAALVLFSIISVTLLWLVNTPTVSAIFPNRDFVFAPYEGHHSIAMRIFILSFYIAFATFSHGSAKARLFFGMDMVLSFLLAMAILDVANATMLWQFGISYSLDFGAILSGLLGFALFSLKLLERGAMPARIRIERSPSRIGVPIIRLTGTLINAGVVAWTVNGMDLRIVAVLRDLTLLGGIGPGVFLFLPVFFSQLYLLALIDARTFKRRAYSPPLSVIVPAHNEQYIIADTIRALDKAAAHYGAPVTILIMNNNSSDATAAIARDSLAACAFARGRVIDVPRPGKSHALNAGLDAVETEFVVRVDADTVVGEDNFSRAMPYFSDPSVGVVGGVPIPPGGRMFDRARLLEVLVKHGFYSIGMGAIRGVIGIPGMFVVYRTDQPRHLGGFVEGMNGEDTDISLRIGELGFHSVVDPRIRYISEVPTSYGHMREQRMRWFRSVYHVSSRCRDLIYSDQATLRGKIILPYMLVNSARRAMLVPLIIFGSLEYLFGFHPENPIIWQSIVAVGVGAPAIVAIVAALINGVPRGVLGLPEYLLFRLLRAYFTLESMLSILIQKDGQDLETPTIKDLVSDSPQRIA
ncbi:glycosyltransferase family 2 protein [Jannaschia sp. 2305UL9-9]|uniref:glycosyltransferase n=1 Tax=Jannaschia sp. 2305UL9-9 TaxID=3121638 RepID=UPI003527854B